MASIDTLEHQVALLHRVGRYYHNWHNVAEGGRRLTIPYRIAGDCGDLHHMYEYFAGTRRLSFNVVMRIVDHILAQAEQTERERDALEEELRGRRTDGA